MERDDLHEAWASLETHLRRTERLNDLLVSQSMTQSAQTPLVREKRWLLFEIVVNYIGVIALGSFAVDHFSQTGTALCAAVLAAALIAINVVLIGNVVAIARIDFQEPVLAIQSALERLKMRRARLTAAILLGGPLLWTPLLVVGLALLGIDGVRALGLPYLAVNVAFGATVAIGGWLAARHFGRRFSGSRWARGAIDALSGSSYREAADFLDTIERFRSAA
jgi:hypothetical protein